jgi:hypothetical protein
VQRTVAAAAILAALTAASGAWPTPVVRGQTPSAPPPATATTRQADGLVRSELSLGGYTTTLFYSPTLAADDPAHRAVLSVGAANARVRVAALETNSPLQIGSMTLGPQGRGTVRHDLWLKASSGGWTLEATESGGAPIGETAIARQAAPAMPHFSAALVPELGNTARLMLRWGTHQGTADVTVTAPPRSTRVTENRGANVTVNRSHTEDTSVLSRARLLAQRNETMMSLPSGHQLSVSFQRSFAVGERSATGGAPRTRGLASDGPDFARLATARPGDVVLLTEASVPRLRIERPMRFGATELAVGNQVPGFPGSYGVWLKRAANGWRLVFNHEPDAWGSQHEPKFDAAEVDVQHSSQHTPSRPFAVALAPTGADRGRLIVIWGPHEWSADFVVPGER